MNKYRESRMKVVNRWLQEYFTKGDVTVLDDVLSDLFVYHGHNGDLFKEDMVNFMEWFMKVFQNQEWEINDFIQADDKIVVRYTGWMTYKGGWFNIKGTNQRVKETGIMIFSFDGDQVKDLWCEMSDANILFQLDALPKNTHEVF